MSARFEVVQSDPHLPPPHRAERSLRADRRRARVATMSAPIEHKWVDVRGWGGALPGTVQCDRCNRVASPTDPNLQSLLASECDRKPR